jgi:aspartate aminotransferase-like enzyme/predicted N-acetyltransferase YhbS
MTQIQFKRADTADEMEQIHRLNHSIFAEEIGQHPKTEDGHLIDRFHDRNLYFVGCKDGEVIGMVSVHDGPEFSVASRLRDASQLAALRAPLEVRLLAIRPEFRNRTVLAGLFWQVNEYAKSHRYSDLLISGIAERQAMYTKMGFRAMGAPVACGSAKFVPMRLPLEDAIPEFNTRQALYGSRWQREHALSLLPGPVALSAAVVNAFERPPVSHRSRAFLADYEDTRAQLARLMGGMRSVILGGSGTLANDAVAANLRAAFGDAEGLVVANGEFGERLIRQAAAAGLRFENLRFHWGAAWDFAVIERALERRPAWVWAVHLETSTGVLNDVARLSARSAECGAAVAADCVSSIGAVDTAGIGEGLFLASGVSGKALGSFAGLAFVFVSEAAIDCLQGKLLCPTFDLIEAVRTRGPVSTVSSPLLMAVHEALREKYSSCAARTERFEDYAELGRWTRTQIRAVGLVPLAAEENAAPTITTFALPASGFVRDCLRAGFRIAHESEYLRKRAWGQIATMGDLDRAGLEPLFAALQADAEMVTQAV